MIASGEYTLLSLLPKMLTSKTLAATTFANIVGNGDALDNDPKQ
jgi:hypothetical protein